MRLQFAYLDPITGGALVQILLAALAFLGLGYQYLRKAFQRVTRVLQKRADIEPSGRLDRVASEVAAKDSPND